MGFALPITLDLAMRRAVVVGGGVVGEDKARTLLEAGAVVTVISKRCSEGLRELARRGELTLLHRAYLPDHLVDVAGRARRDVLAAGLPAASATWARRWEQALDDEFVRLVRSGRIDQAAAHLRSQLTSETSEPRRTPQVAIVGAGPGDGGLLTLRARQLLDEADVVVFDRLVSPDLVEGKPSVYVGKEGKEPACSSRRRGPTQAAINKLLVLLARQGKRVVRLNRRGGDPCIFGRGAEEAEALAAEGIDFEIVPAPTSAIAALASAGIPVTDRRVASSAAIVTGQSSAGRKVNWRGLASSADTIVVLMETASLRHIVTELIAGGLDPTTPSAVVEHSRTPLQQVVTAPVEHLPQHVAEAGLRPPAVIVIGEVVRFRNRIRWFDRDPEAQSPTILPTSAREGQPT